MWMESKYEGGHNVFAASLASPQTTVTFWSRWQKIFLRAKKRNRILLRQESQASIKFAFNCNEKFVARRRSSITDPAAYTVLRKRKEGQPKPLPISKRRQVKVFLTHRSAGGAIGRGSPEHKKRDVLQPILALYPQWNGIRTNTKSYTVYVVTKLRSRYFR